MIYNYRNPEFYTSEVRSQFEIVDMVRINTLPTLEKVKNYYEIHMFSDGFIGLFNNKSGKYLKPNIQKYFKYGLRTIENKTKLLFMHRIIGFAWLDGYEEGKVIDHLNEDKLLNLTSNLEWVTNKTNILRALSKLSQLEISKRNSRGRNGLTYDQVEEIFQLADIGFPEEWIANQMKVTQPCINQILNGKRWSSHPKYQEYMESKLEAVQ